MSIEPNERQDESFAIIPPQALLIIAGLGLLVALYVAFIQQTANVLFFGGIGVAILSMIAWGFLAPEQVKAALTGRTARFGGTAVLVSVIFIVALIAIYILIRGQDIRSDLSQTNNFSLTENVEEILTTLSADPTLTEINLITFLSFSDAGFQDRISILLDDFVRASNGKIRYEFVDPVRNPLRAQRYNVTNRQIVIAALDDNDDPIIDTAETIFINESTLQQELASAIIRISAQGDYRAYIWNVTGALELDDEGSFGLASLNAQFEALNWSAQAVSPLEFGEGEGEIQLLDPAADGEVLIIAGSEQPMLEDQRQILTDYLDQGGNVVLFATTSIDGGVVLSTDPIFSDYLFENFGVRVNNDIAIDPSASLQTPLNMLVDDVNSAHFITSNIPAETSLLFPASHTIGVADELPENVVVTVLANSSPDAYVKDASVITQIVEGTIPEASDDDPRGPLALAVAAENSETGARLVIFGTVTFPVNQWALYQDILNPQVAFDSLSWASGFSSRYENIPPIILQTSAQDAPLFATDEQLRTLNIITVFLLPFGILAVGFFVRWMRRERIEEQEVSHAAE